MGFGDGESGGGGGNHYKVPFKNKSKDIMIPKGI